MIVTASLVETNPIIVSRLTIPITTIYGTVVHENEFDYFSQNMNKPPLRQRS